MSETLTISARFCGPPTSGNGGYSAGLLAGLLDSQQPIEVTLRAPPPLDRPLCVTRGDTFTLHADETLIAQAKPVALELPLARAPSLGESIDAVSRYPGFGKHVFPTCFVCGPARAAGDGLRIFAGPVAGTQLYAAPFTPDASLPCRGSQLAPEIVWAALDCPGYFACLAGRPALLGRISAQLLDRPAPGTQCIVAAWALGHQGRKYQAATALYGAAGELYAYALQTWLLMPS